MKKIFFCLLFLLICISLFTIQKYERKSNANAKDDKPTLSSGWNLILNPDTEKFYNVFFKTEDFGGIFTGHQPLKRTTNGGVNWGYGVVPSLFNIYPGFPIMNDYGNVILLSYSENGPNLNIYLFKSTDFGMSWSITYSNGGFNVSNPLSFRGCYRQVVFVSVACLPAPGVIRSTNGGEGGWAMPMSASNYLMPKAVSYSNIGLLYGIFSAGIGRCKISESEEFTIIKSGKFTRISVIDSNNIVAISGIKYFRSTNAGANWDSTVFPVNLNSISFCDSTTGYMTGSSGKIFKSTNKGSTWVSQITPTTDSLIDCSFLNSSTGYVIGYNGTLLKTNDGGGTSTSITISGFARYSDNNQPVTNGIVKAFIFDKNNSNVIYLDSANIQTDGSYTLTKVPQDFVYLGIFTNSNPTTDYVITYYPSTIYWENATKLYPLENLTNVNIGAIRMNRVTNSNSVKGRITGITDAYTNNIKDAFMYAKSGNTFVMCGVSDANGRYNLQSLPTGNIKIVATRLGFSRDSINVNVTSTSNTDSINFQLQRIILGVKQINSTVPSVYKLLQNYPNPFNSMTNIKWQMKDAGDVKIVLYDISGKEVALLVNEKLVAGLYEIKYDASMLPSGIYFYKLTSGGYTETRKMVLLK